jgi:hypothetical protein
VLNSTDSFCNPSRGPTSTISISDIFGLSGCPTYTRNHFKFAAFAHRSSI